MPDAAHPGDARPPRFVRTRRGRLIGGVCSGLGAQLGVDPLLLRIAFVGLTFLGGAGFWLYLAILLLAPEEGAQRAPIRLRRSTLARIAGVVAILAAAAIALSSVNYGSIASGWQIGLPLTGVALVSVVARYARARLRLAFARSDRTSADLRLAVVSAGIAAAVADATLFALAGAWLAGIDRTAAAWAVVGAGVLVLALAFAGARRALVPALAFALAVAVFAAARVDLHGGFGERVYRPLALSDLRHGYRLGAGRLEVDLRNVTFPAGETSMRIRLGVGEAVVVVPDEVCVTTRARLGGGFVGALDRQTDGLDVNWSQRRSRPVRAPELVLEGQVGLGALLVVDRPLAGSFQPGAYGTNAACRPSIGVAG